MPPLDLVDAMRNPTTTSVIIEHPTGQRTFIQPAKQRLDLPDLYQDQDTTVLGPGQRPSRIRRRRQCVAGDRERLNAQLRRHVNDDRDETGDGIVLVEQDVLSLIDQDLRDSVFTPEPAVSRLRTSPLVRCLIGSGDPP